VLDVYQLASTRHDVFHMPILARRQGEASYLILPAIVSCFLSSQLSQSFIIVTLQNIQFDFNVQHDCGFAKCRAAGTRPRVQERLQSDVIETFIIHEPLSRYIINTHSFHNPHLLRQVVPRSLIAPIPVFNDRRAKHAELAATLRNSNACRREKLKAQREAKKADKTAGRNGDEDNTAEGSTGQKSKKRKTGSTSLDVN
jgi:hypothetical protein